MTDLLKRAREALCPHSEIIRKSTWRETDAAPQLVSISTYCSGCGKLMPGGLETNVVSEMERAHD